MKRSTDINYACSGQGHPVICMHGIGGDAESFRPQLDALADDFQIISWSMPGYGGSAAIDDVSFELLANKLLAFMDALGIETAHLVGQSIGGMIAQEFYHRYPNRVTSLALIATTSAFGGRDESFREAFLKARLAPLDQGQSLKNLAPQFVPQIIGEKAPAAAREAAIRSMAAVPDASYRNILKCLVTFNRRAEFSSISVPCCLIAGEVDSNAPAKTMLRMAESLAGAEFHQVPGAGHLVNLECANETNQILRDFLSPIDIG
jgi:3-oxoadipate enol-lactonase